MVEPVPEPAPAPVAEPVPGGPVKVGVLLPLSGPNATIGKAMLDAAQMALFDVGDKELQLLPRDTQGTPQGAAEAAQAVLNEGARFLIGPLLAGEVEQVKPIAKAANVRVLAFSTATQLAGDGTYLMGFLPKEEVSRVVAYAHQKGMTKFAALAPNSAYGQIAVEALKAAVDVQGSVVTQVEFYDPQATDVAPSIRRLAEYEKRRASLAAQRKQLEAAGDDASKAALQRMAAQTTSGDADFDALLIPEGVARLKTLAPLLPYYDLDPARVKFLGTGLWDEPGLASEPALVGAWYAAAPLAQRRDFERRYQQLYGSRPVRLATLGYDAAALAAVLAREEKGPDFSDAALTNPSGFAGLDGIFRLRADGLVQRGLAVMEIQRNGSPVVGPAAETFEQFTN